jgi:hypothetical protein
MSYHARLTFEPQGAGQLVINISKRNAQGATVVIAGTVGDVREY